MQAVHHLDTWYEENKELFSPPVCNKLMHKEQMTIMFVGGPNVRTDFHLDEGSEFFWMYRGRMELPIIEQGKRRVVKINEGEVFCLPSRVPHSPQRPVEGSLGLVIERERYKDKGELDGLRWYTDFEKCDEILWERYFHCWDLGRDLVPVVNAFKSSKECETGQPTGENIIADPPVKQDVTTKVPDPFNLNDWLEKNKEALSNGEALNLFGDTHPDKEFKVLVVGGQSKQEKQCWKHDTWLFQVRGTATVSIVGKDEVQVLNEKCCGIIPPNTEYSVVRDEGSIGFVVTNDPVGNKK